MGREKRRETEREEGREEKGGESGVRVKRNEGRRE